LSNGSVFLATLVDRIDDRWRWLITIALTAGAAIYAFWPVARLASGWNDSSFLYAAGRTWITGFSPYDFQRWNAEWTAVRPIAEVGQPMPFVYPPHWGPVAVLLAQLPWPVASRVWDVVNVVAYLGASVFTLRICGGNVRELVAKPAVWMFLAIATLNVAVRQSVFQGQFTIVPLLGIAGAFWAWHEKKTTWLVLFAFVASLKPQLGLLPLLYLFLNGGHVAVLWAGAAAGAIGLLSMWPSHIERLPADLSHVATLHTQLDFNQPGQYFNLPALAAGTLAGHSFMMAGPIMAIIVVIAMTCMRWRGMASAVLRDPLWQLSILAALTGALLPVHAYDLVVYAPLGLLAYRLRFSWMSPVLLAFILIAGRSHLFPTHLHMPPLPAPLVTGAVAMTVVYAAYRHQAERIGQYSGLASQFGVEVAEKSADASRPSGVGLVPLGS
jgi:hypothetical protein